MRVPVQTAEWFDLAEGVPTAEMTVQALVAGS